MLLSAMTCRIPGELDVRMNKSIQREGREPSEWIHPYKHGENLGAGLTLTDILSKGVSEEKGGCYPKRGMPAACITYILFSQKWFSRSTEGGDLEVIQDKLCFWRKRGQKLIQIQNRQFDNREPPRSPVRVPKEKFFSGFFRSQLPSPEVSW